MSSLMQFIRPTPIGDAELASSSVAENDYAAWDAGTTYTQGDRCIRTQTHRIYERLVSGTTGTPPEGDAVNWLDAGPTNRWAMFDEKVGTATTAADTLTVVLEPGLINSLAILSVDAAQVSVTLEVDSNIEYQASFDLVDNSGVGDWYQYFYEPLYQQDSITITDLLDAALLSIPIYGSGVLTVTFTKAGGTVSVGMLVVGLVTALGETQAGASVSIRDYSRKEADQFGNHTLVRRDYSKLISTDVVVEANRVDFAAKELSRYRATSVVWIGSSKYGALVAYGFVADWRVVIENAAFSMLHVEIEGMT